MWRLVGNKRQRGRLEREHCKMEAQERLRSDCMGHWGLWFRFQKVSLVANVEAELERMKYKVRSENQLWCCLMKEEMSQPARVTRKRGDESYFLDTVERIWCKMDEKVRERTVRGDPQPRWLGRWPHGLLLKWGTCCVGMCSGWVVSYPRTDITLQSGWPKLQKIMFHSARGKTSRIKSVPVSQSPVAYSSPLLAFGSSFACM